MRILFLGDVVAEPGREAVRANGDGIPGQKGMVELADGSTIDRDGLEF